MRGYKTKTGGFSCLGEFLVTVRKACTDGIQNNFLVKTAGHMEEGEDSQGGYLVPEQWADDILYVALEDSIVRGNGAIVLGCKTDSLKIRKLVDTSRSSNIFGGVNFYWLAEAAQKSASGVITNPALGELELTPHKLIGSCFASNELESDYANFGNFMAIAFGRALVFIEDDYFIWGNGVGQPLGFMNSGALITLTRNAVTAFNWVDISNMVKRLLPDSWKRAVWLINPDSLDELFEATSSAANQAVVLDLASNTLFGRPIIITEKAETVGVQGDLILADFGHYVIADREMTISASRETNVSDVGFLTDETFWKIVLRVDGQPLMSAAISPKRGANSLSAFVALSASTS